MPAINQPKLGELYNTTFFTPSSLISSVIIPKSNVAWTDGQGGVYYVAALTMPILISTVEGLGTAGYVSSTQLISTVADLGSAGYISSPQLLSTVKDLGTGGYVSSTQLFSTVAGLGTAGYISTGFVLDMFQSTVAGLGTAGYVSSTQLTSTLEYIQNNFVSTPTLISTVDGLGTAGYVSSTQLVSTTDYFLQNYVSSGQALSTTNNLGSLNYISTSQLVSTVEGLGSVTYVSSTQLISSIDYILTNYVSSGQLVSTVNNLASINYVSSTQLASTVEGLGTANYVSSTQLASTVEGLGTANYVSSTQLLSTVAGLGTANYVSSTQLLSTVAGLGTANYVSSTQLTSTVEGLGTANYVSSTQLASTVAGLGTANYVSSTQLISTVANLLTSPVVQNLRVLGTLSTSSTFTNFVSTSQLFANTISANTVVVWGSNTLIVQGASLLSTTTVSGNLNVSTVSGSNGFVNSTGVSTSQVQTSSILFRDTFAPSMTYNLYVNQGAPYLNNNELVQDVYVGIKLASTVAGLGTANYVSSTQLASTVAGLSFATFVSTSQLTSTVAGLGTAGYISSTQLISTVDNLGSVNYVSSTQLISTVAGLAFTTYISSTQLASTVAGLGTAGYISSQQLTSTFDGLTQGFITSTLRVAGAAFAVSTYTKFASTTYYVGLDIQANKNLPIAALNLAYSTDATNWNNPTNNGFLTQGNAVAAGSNLWVAVGDSSNAAGSIKWSVNGTAWSDAESGGFTNENGDHIGYAIAYSASLNRYVAGGDGGSALTSLRHSSDGKNWQTPVNGVCDPVYGLTWAPGLGPGGGGLFIAVGDGEGVSTRSIAYSADGSNWTPVLNGFSNNTGNATIGYNVAFGNGRLWAVGYGNVNSNMLTSVNGSNWVRRTDVPGAYFNQDGGFGIAYSSNLGKWVATGNDFTGDNKKTIIVSADATGLTGWSYANSGGFNRLGNTVIWDGTKFVAGGKGTDEGGVIQTSTDGANWVATSATPFEYFGSYIANGIAYSNSQYIAVGDGETLTGGALTTLINPSSISTKTITAETIIVDSITVTGQNTLIVNGNSYFDGPAEFSTSITTMGLNVNGGANFLSSVTLFGSNLGLTAPFLSTLQLTTSTVRLVDTVNRTSTNLLYTASNTLFYNSNQVLIGGGSSGTDLTLNNLRVLGTISSSSTFTNFVQSSTISACNVVTSNTTVSTLTLKDIQFASLFHKLYASSSQLYFNTICVTSSFVGNGCGVCIDSNIAFSNVQVVGTLSTLSTYTTFISSGMADLNTINAIAINTVAINTSNAQTSSLTLEDNALGNLYDLYAQSGTLYFGNTAIGAIPNVVDSNLWVDTLRVNFAISTNTLFANSISSGVTSVSTMNLIDQTTNTANPLYAAGGILYFGNNQVLPFGPDMMFSSIAVRNTISTSSTFMRYLSSVQIDSRQLVTSSITAVDLVLSKISTLEVQTSSLRLVDTAAATRVGSFINTNNNLTFNNMAVAMGGTFGFAPQFSTLRIAQNISTSSTFTNVLSTSQLTANQFTTSSINTQGINTVFASTANVALSSLTFVGGSRVNMYGTTSNLYYNNLAVALGGPNSQNAIQSTITVQNTVTASSTLTNVVSSMITSAFQVQNTSSIQFVDAVTGGTNFLFTSNQVLYLNNSPGIGIVTVASNLVLSNLQVLDTLSTTSTFMDFISTAQIGTSSLTTTALTVYESTITNTLNTTSDLAVAGNLSITGNTSVNTVNTRPYPIFNWGSSNIECCGSGAGFAEIDFPLGSLYTTTPIVTVTLNDLENNLAILNVVYKDNTRFIVGAYNIATGALTSNPQVTFNWMAIGT